MAYNYPDNLSLIATRTASTSASLEFTSVITSNWNTYYITFENLIPVTNTVNFNLTFSNDNGSTYLATNYQYSYLNIMTAGTATAEGSNSTTEAQLAKSIENGASYGINGFLYMYNLNSASIPCFFHGRLSHYSAAGVGVWNILNSGSNTDTTGIDALKFAFSSGNISSGKIYLYGVNEP